MLRQRAIFNFAVCAAPGCCLFQKSHPIADADDIDRAMQVASEADLMLAVGSTLQVWPVAGSVELAHRAGARVLIMNDQATPLDGLAALLLRGPIGELLPAICGA